MLDVEGRHSSGRTSGWRLVAECLRRAFFKFKGGSGHAVRLPQSFPRSREDNARRKNEREDLQDVIILLKSYVASRLPHPKGRCRAGLLAFPPNPRRTRSARYLYSSGVQSEHISVLGSDLAMHMRRMYTYASKKFRRAIFMTTLWV